MILIHYEYNFIFLIRSYDTSFRLGEWNWLCRVCEFITRMFVVTVFYRNRYPAMPLLHWTTLPLLGGGGDGGVIQYDTQTVNAGEKVEMECVSTGKPFVKRLLCTGILYEVKRQRISRYNFDWTLWTGFPLPTVTWSREDAALPQRAIVNEAFLIIQSIRPEDAGTYVCTVENTGGRVTRKVTLFVRGITQYQKRKIILKNFVVIFSHWS